MAQIHITILPTEIISSIIQHVESLDMLSLRSTCRALADKTSAPFRDHFFHTRYVMLERQSLQNIVEISRHPALSAAVRVVELTMDHLVAPPDYMSPADYRMCGINDDCDYERHLNGETISLGDESYKSVITSYKAEWGPYRDFLQTNLGVTCLAEALSNLPNCKAVGIDDYTRPWGAFRLGRRIGSLPTRLITPFQAQSMIFATLLIRTLLLGVVRSRRAMERLYIQFGDLKEGCTSVTPRMLSMTPRAAEIMRNQLGTITTLQLVVNPNHHENTFDEEAKKLVPHTDPIHAEISDWCLEFCNFLRLFPAIANFTLHFNPCDEGQQFPRLSRDLHIPGLRSLCLEFLDCTTDELIALLGRHKDTLRELILETVNITGGGLKAWSSLLRSLERSLSLEIIDFGNCMVDGYWLQPHRTASLSQRLRAEGSEEIKSMWLAVDEMEESEDFPPNRVTARLYSWEWLERN